MTYFVISDIHSYYDEMILSLRKKSYDQNNKNHHLIVLGDLFDRGPKSKEVLLFLYDLHKKDKATIILGNHDIFLLELIERNYKRTLFNMKHNGHATTLKDLSGLDPDESNLEEVRKIIMEKYPFLYDFISSFPLFYELGEYVFVHGGIDGTNKEWRKNTTRRDFVWGKEFELERIPGKTVVCGHTRVATIRRKTKNYELLYSLHKELFDIYRADGKIMIDRYVEISKELNVLLLEL